MTGADQLAGHCLLVELFGVRQILREVYVTAQRPRIAVVAQMTNEMTRRRFHSLARLQDALGHWNAVVGRRS